MTQEELATRANVSTRAVSDLERGTRRAPHRATVARLSAALALSAEERGLLERGIQRKRAPRQSLPAVGPVSSLPQPVTPLVGRRRDVEEITHRLRWGGVRLLTLFGPGGVGKTRVAIAAAQALGPDCPGGPIFVALAPLRDAGFVAPAIASALGVPEASGRSAEENLVAHLRGRDAILVLDNFEHVAASSPLLSLLLRECSLLKMVVTSRTALKIQGEHRMEIAPLEVPGREAPWRAGAAVRYPAIVLFTQRAQAVRHDFAVTDANLATVVEICQQLDGLPLAIELAAARVAHLSLPSLLMRLKHQLHLLTDGPTDLPPRQQTMRATIAWSYDLLNEPERRLLRQLSVFAGGWSLEAAEAVCGGWQETERMAVFDRLTALIDRSLVNVSAPAGAEPRYRMLVTIREFAGEQLAAHSEVEATRAAHARFFLALAEEAEPQLTGREQVTWLERLEIEHGNLREALSWARLTDDVDLALRLSTSLWRFWQERGHAGEGQRWQQAFLPWCERSPSRPLQARALYAAGAIAYGQGRYDEARQHFEASLAVSRELSDTTQLAQTLNGLGVAATSLGHYDQALAYLREAVAVHRASGQSEQMAPPLNNIANIVRYRGHLAEAIGLYEECLEIYRRTGMTSAYANTLNNLALVVAEAGDAERGIALARESLTLFEQLDNPLGRTQAITTLGAIAMDRGDDELARPLIEESLELARASEDTVAVGIALVNLGALAFRRADYDRAEALAHESEALFGESHARRCQAYSRENLGDVAQARGDWKRARALYQESLEIRREVQYVAGAIDSLERLAGLACAEERWNLATQQYGTAATLRARFGIPAPPVLAPRIERNRSRAHALLGEAAFNAAWQEGERAARDWIG